MFRPVRLFSNGQRPPEEGGGFRISALGFIHHGSIVETFGDVRMFGLQDLLSDGQRTAMERPGFGIPALEAVEFGQVVEGLAQSEMF